MSQWRVTAEHPVRNLDGLDHERCAALNNLIVERGWTASGRNLTDLDTRTWWECYGGDEELSGSPLAVKLSPAVIAFLKTAWHGYVLTAEPEHAFFRYLARLCFPHELWEHAMYGEDEDDSNQKRYITLYMANWALGASHPLGLVFDQQTSTAMQHISMHDSSVTMNGRQSWLPLEVILEGFLDMIDQGKALAVDSSWDGEQERINPWIMPSYTTCDMDQTLEAFDRLARAIETRMPRVPGQESYRLSDAMIDVSAFPNTFAGQFVTRAREIRFIHIAPGLRIARQQPFASMDREEGKLKPILLFDSGLDAHQDTMRAPWGQEVLISPFPEPANVVTKYPAGLYLTAIEPYSSHPFEDGCQLRLPYAIGGNGWARTSDGALFGENIHARGATANPEPRSTQIHQQGFNHFIESHDVQLKHVLSRWAEMVEKGKWMVDIDGVAGGIQKWREADTEEHWQHYCLPLSW